MPRRETRRPPKSQRPLLSSPMKILLINTSDHTGGAAIAALRLLKALRSTGAQAQLLCRDRTLPPERTDVLNLKPTLWRKAKFALERLEICLHNRLSRRRLFEVDTARMGNDITRLKAFKEADVIHLHWTNQALLSLADLRRILQSGKRVVWTLHDMWPFTAICHHADRCQRWRTGQCGQCPLLLHPSRHDLAYHTYQRKLKAYSAGPFTAVACSHWLEALAREAPLFKDKRVVSIPNPIDTQFYAPAGSEGQPTQAQVRQQLQLPPNKHLLLFAAYKLTNPYKGIDYLEKALVTLTQSQPELAANTGILLAGGESQEAAERLRQALQQTGAATPPSLHPLGYVTDEEQMRRIYQASNLLLMPTLMDNLPNTIAEAMATAVPCVAFNVGGVPQMVQTGVNGYLARYLDATDFAEGISRVLLSPSYTALCRNARAHALKAYSEQAVAEQYLRIYRGEELS